MRFLSVRAENLPVPLALYPLNGRHGTFDIGPSKNPPGITGNVHLAPGPYGQPQGSYQFSGTSSSYIKIPNNGGPDTKYSITVLSWVNRENHQGPIFNYGDNINGFHFWIWGCAAGCVFANLYPDWVTQPHSPIPSNSWHYVGASYDFSSGTAKVWVNGQAGTLEPEVRHSLTTVKINIKIHVVAISQIFYRSETSIRRTPSGPFQVSA